MFPRFCHHHRRELANTIRVFQLTRQHLELCAIQPIVLYLGLRMSFAVRRYAPVLRKLRNIPSIRPGQAPPSCVTQDGAIAVSDSLLMTLADLHHMQQTMPNQRGPRLF